MEIDINDIRNRLLGVDYSNYTEAEARERITEIEQNLDALQNAPNLKTVNKKMMISKLKKERRGLKKEFEI